MLDTLKAPAAPADKGLAAGKLGLLPSTIIGLASTAPLFSLAATLGFIVMATGAQAPAALICAFVPMCLTAFAYKELNTAVPDSGTAFAWGAKAFGPKTGWMAGWGVLAAGIIIMASQTEIASKYLLMLLGSDLHENKVLVTAFGAIIIIVMTWISYRNVESGAWTQYVLMAIQYLAIILFCIGLFFAIKEAPALGLEFSWQWFNPFAADNPAGFIQAILLGIFIYWGWDTCLALAEETKNPRRTPGLAALLSTTILLITYIGISVLTMMYAGIGDKGQGLGNPDIAEDVFYDLRVDALGEWGWILILAVAVSALSTCQTTILPTARGTLSMGVYKALPKRFAVVNERFQTPTYSTIFTGTASLIFYVGMTIISYNILQDTIESTSLAVAMYYAITSFACIWYFRKNLFDTGRNFIMRFLLPLIGGIMMTIVFVLSCVFMLDPDYGETTIWGVSGTFVMGVGALALGVVVMYIWSKFPGAKEYFAGESLNEDTPVLVPEP